MEKPQEQQTEVRATSDSIEQSPVEIDDIATTTAVLAVATGEIEEYNSLPTGDQVDTMLDGFIRNGQILETASCIAHKSDAGPKSSISQDEIFAHLREGGYAVNRRSVETGLSVIRANLHHIALQLTEFGEDRYRIDWLEEDDDEDDF